jgi:uroporphyrinogen decarboxylase
MNSRDRVRRAITFQKPDHYPYFHRFYGATRARYADLIAGIEARYPGDMAASDWDAPATLNPPGGLKESQAWRDEWGCIRSTGIEGLTGIVVGHPLADWDTLQAYGFPDYRVLIDWQRAIRLISEQPEMYHAAMYPGFNLFERLQALRGYSTLLLDVVEGGSSIYKLRDRVVETMLVAITRWLEIGVDTIAFGDDWGTQTSLMINPTTWRSFFQPAYARLFEPVKRAGRFIQFHSDGMIPAIIPDLIELGVNILNVQHNLIGLERLRPLRGKVCFLTHMDSQYVLPYGTPADVRQHVREVFEALGTEAGGIIGYAPLGPDVPPANIEALYSAYTEFGRQS